MTTPLGYKALKNVDSINDIYNINVIDKSISITKSAIQQFLEDFLHPQGRYRSYLKATVSPEGLQYVTDLSFDDEMKSDPNLRKVHLAKFFAENTGRLPSILLIDQGYEYSDSGLNELVESRSFQGKWVGNLTYLSKISMSVLVASYAEEETSVLSTLVLYILASLAQIISNGVIREKGKRWEVRMPMNGITASQMTSIAVEGDNKSQIWTRSIELAVDFESVLQLKVPMPDFAVAESVVGKQPGDPKPKVLNLTQNQKIPLGSQFTLFIENMRLNHYLSVSNPNVALVTRTPPFIIQPRNRGRCLLYVLDESGNATQNPETGEKNNLILDIPFQVV